MLTRAGRLESNGFLPTGVTLLLLWLAGVWMFWVPFWAKRKRNRSESGGGQRGTTS
jgi:hypothetical protein